MNENTTPQISGSQPNPAEIGIPSVAGKKSSPAKNRNLALMAALVVLMLICIAVGFYQKHSARNAQPKQQEQATPMLSGRTLTLPPLSQIQPPEAPAILTTRKTDFTVMRVMSVAPNVGRIRSPGSRSTAGDVLWGGMPWRW